MLGSLDGQAARRWALGALAALGEAREEIDALNVFPVPDGDTGTNMYLTLESAVAAAAEVPPDAPIAVVAEAFAHGALLGARGNSGVIGAQLLRGWADTLAEYEVIDAESAVEGFRRSDEQAWRAVNDPVEGTILSVSRAAAQAAAAAPRRLEAVVRAATAAAAEALALTPRQLPALARAGVVDAGGRGFVVMLQSMTDLVGGASRRRPSRQQRPVALPEVDLDACAADHGGDGGPAYEVMYLLEAEDAKVDELRAALAPLGDSLVVVGGGGLWNVHVHVDDAGAAVEAGVAAGAPRRIKITHFGDQLREQAEGARLSGRAVERRQSASRRTRGGAGVGLVAVAAGPGLAALFRDVGATVVPGGPGGRPSTGQILQAVRDTGASSVAVLPNDGDTLAVAQAAAVVARAEGIRVTVLPTRAQVQGIAAAAVHDAHRSFDDDVVTMSAAAGGARDGAVTVAARDGLTTAGECHAGDVLGVVDGDFAVIGDDLATVAVEVARRLLSGGGELVTIVVGEGGHDATAEAVAEQLRRGPWLVEVVVVQGGQRRYPLLLGVE